MTVLLWMLATITPLLALLKLRDLWRHRPLARGKYSTIFGPTMRVVMVENKSFLQMVRGR